MHLESCAAALESLASGFSSLADGPMGGRCVDVLICVVCASRYLARSPRFHTDKVPLRGYVTLRGHGTEFVCADGGDTRHAEELEFIVMKGDHCSSSASSALPASLIAAFGIGKQAACTHRSPVADTNSPRRVILSFDLATGDDNREWRVVDTKREWRSGFTKKNPPPLPVVGGYGK